MKLKELRKSRGLLQREVAEVVNCSQAVYSRYETGEREPPFDIIQTLANYYGVTVDYLMGADTRIIPQAPAPAPAPRPNPASGLTLEEQAELDQLTSTIGVMTRNNINPGTTDRKKLEHLRIAKKLFDNAWPENSTKAEPEKPQQKAPTPDRRAEAKALLEGMTDEQYQAALQYLKFLQSQKGG